ncbi:MAG: ribose-phosphate pyrophosphokinase [Pseudomonadota bacterium]
MLKKMMLFSGNSNPTLFSRLTKHLNLPAGQAIVDRFSDEEIQIEITENVRGHHVFIVQSTNPPAEHLIELLLMADALHRASAARITAVLPYYGYARQDRRIRSARVPISAKVIADMIASAGIDRILTVDLHADQIQGFFDIPVDNVYSTPLILDDIKTKPLGKVMVISPDVGGVIRARAITKHIPGSDLAIIDKRRSKPNQSSVMHVIGDVKGCDCVIVDDIVDTAGTLCQAVSALKERGANSVTAYVTHPVLSGPAVDNINKSELDELVITDTIEVNDQVKNCSRIRQISIADMLSQSIKRVHDEQSISSLFI